MFIKKAITATQAFEKLKHYCGYQERSHYEVKEKLYSFGLRKVEVELLISQLIEQDYLNEERFAIQFAGGKFRMKSWGKIKIRYELVQKKVSEYNIKKALKTIDNKTYEQCLQNLAEKKWQLLRHEQYINRQAKTINYLLQKGFEPLLIQAAIKNIRNSYK